MMKKTAFLLALLLLASLPAHAQTTIKVSQLPVPSTGSTKLSNGDIVVSSRNGVTYGLQAAFAGTCAASNWVNLISPQGVGSCAQPTFGDISGSLPLSQISGIYTNGQLLIGNTSSGHVQAATLTAGSNITITNGPGSVTISGNAPTATIATSSPVTVGSTSVYIFVNKAVGSATTVNLPSSPTVSQTVLIKDLKGDANVNNITINGGTSNIDGAASYVIGAARGAVTLFWNSIEWSVIS